VLLTGSGERKFCAGADVKATVQAVVENRKSDAMQFFTEEYALDLCIHQFPKPVVAIAHGINMGGGLGLTAGADLVMATETTRMAMPKIRIGFFPDVWATGWLFAKCPSGYPEFLGLTGHELVGPETVRLGLSDVCVSNKDMDNIIESLKDLSAALDEHKDTALGQIKAGLGTYHPESSPKINTDFDQWVAATFAGKAAITDIISALSRNSENSRCETVLEQLAERSPTATVLTLTLLRQNQGKPLADVFASETKACDFIISHPDYREGVRARLVDKDNAPKGQPDTFEEVALDVDI